MKKLGFGLMRLPLLKEGEQEEIDIEQVKQMADVYLSHGFCYFDTATPYHNGKKSEEAFQKAVASRYPRDSYWITDKLSFPYIHQEEDLEPFLKGQLSRCGVTSFNLYLLHAMNKERFEQAKKLHAYEFVLKKKEEGVLQHIGFSFHDSPEVLEEMLQEWPEIEYVQLQINYLDWEDENVASRRCYEIAKKYNKKILIMEPIKGGLLASLPEEAKPMLSSLGEESPASYALKFCASLEGVEMVLSGMSSIDQVNENVKNMSFFAPLGEKENHVLFQIADLLRSKTEIPCTGCSYCTKGCPKHIPIPDYFQMINRKAMFPSTKEEEIHRHYEFLISKGCGKASDCIRCGACERACPQKIKIREELEKVAKILEK